jgi:hypothetical protein
MIDKQLGVSNDTLQMQLGYNPDVEREKKKTQMEELGSQLLGAFDRGKESSDDDEEAA